ncbi:hypothetical protein Trydic_g19134 [Trypoxylus dichotomus]
MSIVDKKACKPVTEPGKRASKACLVSYIKDGGASIMLKALGEPIRFLLKYGGIDFEDNRVEFDDWPKVKPTIFFGQLPIYEEDGKKVNQSIAISRYLGKKVNLVGNSDWENLEIDAVVDTINDLRLKLVKYSYEKDEKIKEEVKGPLFNEILPFYLEKLEKIAEASNGHLAINKLTWADFYFIAVLDYFNYMAEMDLLENRPSLQKVKENVTSIPVIKDWITIRPDTYIRARSNAVLPYGPESIMAVVTSAHRVANNPLEWILIELSTVFRTLGRRD